MSIADAVPRSEQGGSAEELSGWETHEPVAETDGLRGLVADIERRLDA